MDTARLPYEPGSLAPAGSGPLARYLPPLPPGMVSGWLRRQAPERVPPGVWLFDPLGASPAMVLEAALAGYRVLVACNNPILSFMIETLASAPDSGDFQSVLAALAASRRGEERLEAHIQSLYETECDDCGATVPAQAFLWRKDESQPFARIYHCPRCRAADAPPVQRDVTPADLERLSRMGGDRLQRARAVQRVILNADERRADVEAALENYLPRPLYALFTLLNKCEGLDLPPERRRLLNALMISAFDAGNALWPHPTARSRPRQLITPPVFRENNVWAAVEDGAAQWMNALRQLSPDNRPPARVPVTRWPELPPESGGGICLFRGRVKALMPLPPEVQPAALVTVFPRPNQAFWTLSALWAGWLWGPEAALPLRNTLDRRRYDWNWHTTAVHSALSAVSQSVPANIPFFGLLPDLAPGFLSAVIAACESAGFHLEGLALRAEPLSRDPQPRGEQFIAQGLWQPEPRANPPAPPAEDWEQIAREGISADLLERAEPAHYISAYAAGLTALASARAIPRRLSSIPGDLLPRIQAVLARVFAGRGFLKHYGPQGEERGMWWLANHPPLEKLTLADRVEMEIVRFMQNREKKEANAVFHESELEAALLGTFAGLHVPESAFIRACLESYGQRARQGEPCEGDSPLWQLPPGETAASRRADLQEILALLVETGRRLGFNVTAGTNAVTWSRAGEEWRFYCIASSIISRYVLANPPAPDETAVQRVIVLPGSRAQLLQTRLRRDPRLAEAASGWHFLKFRHLRQIASRPNLTLQLWAELLESDPLSDEAVQIPLF